MMVLPIGNYRLCFSFLPYTEKVALFDAQCNVHFKFASNFAFAEIKLPPVQVINNLVI